MPEKASSNPDIGIRLDEITTKLKEAREANDTSGVDTQLTNLSVALNEVKQKSEKERSILQARVKLASAQVDVLAASNNQRAKEMQAVFSGIHSDLDSLSANVVVPAKTGEVNEDNVPAFVKNAATMFSTGYESSIDGLKFAGGKIVDSAKYMWNFVAEPLKEFFGKVEFPPVLLYAKQMIAGMLPGEMGARMKKDVELQLKFRSLLSQAEDIVKAQNTVRAKKQPPEAPITLDVSSDNFVEFSLLTPQEQAQMPRKIMEAIRKGSTEVSFGMLYSFDEEKSGDTKNTKEKDTSTDVVEATIASLPDTPISFDEFQKGIDIPGFGKVRIERSPAGVTVDGRTWRVKGTGVTRLASFALDKGEWTGDKLNITITGSSPVGIPAPQTESGVLKKDDAFALLKHLSKNSDPFPLTKADGTEAPASLELL